MNYAGIYYVDLANGPGLRVSLFVSGCKFHCKNCFNQEAQDYSYGQLYNESTYNHLISLVDKPYISGLSILGGDPLWQSDDDIWALCRLVDDIHKLGKSVWLWTGFKWEDVMDDYNDARRDLMTMCDVVVDGQYVDELRDLNLVWKGSSNQRVIDVKKSLEAHEIIIYKENNKC